MPSFYVYLISSLPALTFGMKPLFSLEGFFEKCQGLIPDRDIILLKEAVSGSEKKLKRLPAVVKQWRDFDGALRNELVRPRAVRKKADASQYLRQQSFLEQHVIHTALAAYRNPSILDAERYLDTERWRFLDGLQSGHIFDWEFLIIYALKLIILERWEEINTADKGRLTEALLEEVNT